MSSHDCDSPSSTTELRQGRPRLRREPTGSVQATGRQSVEISKDSYGKILANWSAALEEEACAACAWHCIHTVSCAPGWGVGYVVCT